MSDRNYPSQKSARGRQSGDRRPVQASFATSERMSHTGSAIRPPLRAVAGGQGTLGRSVELSANHFTVKFTKTKVFHYDIEIRSKLPSSVSKKVITQFLKKDGRINQVYPVFDGKKNIYTARQIPNLNSKVEIPFKFEEEDKGKVQEVVIYLQPTGNYEIDLSAMDNYCKNNGTSVDIPQRPIQAMDIAMRFSAAQRHSNVLIGNCLLSIPRDQKTLLNGGVEVYFGHFQSLRLGWGPFLNVNCTQRAFYESGKVHVVMARIFGTKVGETPRHWDLTTFKKMITNLKVTYRREKYLATVGCNGLKGPADREKFDYNGRMITVQEYFEQKLKIKLEYPWLPCVWVGNRARNNLVPMELCTIPEGQEYRKKLSDFQTSNMIKFAATPADVRKEKILDAVRSMNFGQDPYMKEFGISVDTSMAKVRGRVLPEPNLQYGNNQKIAPKDGVWGLNNKVFYQPGTLQHYGFLNTSPNCQRQEIVSFNSELTKIGSSLGMKFGQCHFIDTIDPKIRLENDMTPLVEKMNSLKIKYPQLQILFVIIKQKGDLAYEVVKRVGDLDLNLTTQCIAQKNLRSSQPTLSNICLKLNAKIGGIDNIISLDSIPGMLMNEQVIFMGADVTHPGADQQFSNKPSIAAVVGSMGPSASKYCCEISIQKSKQEYIENMESMVCNLLRKFFHLNRGTSTGKPQRIIFYRDGVSEGQFASILEWELSAIRRACKSLENGYEPPITFIVVQKRHHTRLFPEHKRDECGRGKNVPPGTVVDSQIVHPSEQDFFLVSHLGIQGTSRPTHYHVLWDDSKFSSDKVQLLTYYLCHMFARCTRSVSYPAPCYYAHLVAYRGRHYYDNMERNPPETDLQSFINKSRDLKAMFFA